MRRILHTRSLVALAAVLALVLTAGACGSDGEASGGGGGSGGDTIKLALMLPLSGDGASFGEDNRVGAEIALEMFNAAGGIDGKDVELIVVDVTTPEQAQTEAERLISSEGVNILMGTAFSSLAIPASAIADRRGKVFWELSAASNEITGRGFERTFQLNAYASALGSTGVEFVADELADDLGKSVSDLRTATIYTDDAFGADLGKSMAETSKEVGMQVLLEESYNSTATDLSPLIVKLRDLDLDVLFASTQERDAILLYQQSKELDFYVPIFADTIGFDTPSTAEALGDDINGAFATTTPVHTAINPDGLTAEGQALLEQYAERFRDETGGRKPSSDSDLAFAGTWVLLEHVLKAVGSDDIDEVVEAARALDLPAGSLPNGYGVKFDENGHNTAAFPVVEQWQDGSLQVVSPAELATAEPIAVPLPPWAER